MKADDKIDLSLISRKILELYSASRARVRFAPEDIVDSVSRAVKNSYPIQDLLSIAEEPLYDSNLGSNNWVVRGKLTFSGFPMMANDPHRSQQVPSLRYWAHLVAPGWNVIGSGEHHYFKTTNRLTGRNGDLMAAEEREEYFSTAVSLIVIIIMF